INPYDAEAYPFKQVSEVTQVDDDGVGLSVGEKCELRAVVYGTNLRPNGFQFTIIDQLKDGIGVFLNTGNKGFTVTEGFYISVKGTIDQYNGLLQIIPDTIIVISEDPSQYPPYVVTKLDESTESQLVTIKNCSIKNPSEWKGDGSSFNVTVTNGTDDFTMRIDNDVDLSTMNAPDYSFNLTGIGGQYDPSKPYTEGYQILPRYSSDLEKILATNNLDSNALNIYPNPTSQYLNIEAGNHDYSKLTIYNLFGDKVLTSAYKNKLDISFLNPGIYYLTLNNKNETATAKFIKQ
ncbi:MAG TPA: T9SS type A sorting domain-containing protein, partial [Bacteroidetes bacterium]|nr:T9SS type A sorting domain-containing protein [Bacteroidota bacterium]